MENSKPLFIEVIVKGSMSTLIHLSAIKYVRPYADMQSIIVLFGEEEEDQQVILEPYSILKRRILEMTGQK